MNACCSGCSAGDSASPFCCAYNAGNPSSVVTALFTTFATGGTQERISTPSASTEQEPHCAKPQPKRGPRNSNSLVSTYSKGVSGVLVTGHSRPFTLIFNSSAMAALPIEDDVFVLIGGVQ